MLVLRPETDIEVETQRAGDLLGEELTDAVPGDPPNDLAQDPAEGAWVIAVVFAGFPNGSLRRDGLNDRIPGQHFPRRQIRFDDGQTRLMCEDPPDRNLCLARLPEFGPVAGDGFIEVESSLLDELVNAGRRQPLGRREDQCQRVLLPRQALVGVSMPAPEVDDGSAIQIHAESGAVVAPAVEIALEGFRDRFESRLDVPVDGCRGLATSGPLRSPRPAPVALLVAPVLAPELEPASRVLDKAPHALQQLREVPEDILLPPFPASPASAVRLVDMALEIRDVLPDLAKRGFDTLG